MRRIKSSYEFRESQVFTPPDIVRMFWKLVLAKRKRLGSVIDLGAGDGRFAQHGNFERYLGIEIDDQTIRRELPKNAKIKYGCVFESAKGKWDAAIGNPPYVRNHYIEMPWMDRVAKRFRTELGVEINRQANLFVYFMLLGLEITKDDGLVAMVTPYEWVSRPSAKPLRELIEKSGWSVSVYRFKEDIFDGVMTTAAISIIDKKDRSGKWSYFEVGDRREIRARRLVSGSKFKVLPYAKRGQWSAQRGLSPGTQKVFTLTEGERIHHGLSLDDVAPCVTSLKPLDGTQLKLDEKTFRKYFRDAGEKCWLIRSDETKLSSRLRAYLDSVAAVDRATATCEGRDVWYQYKPFPVCQILVASGFTSLRPKIVRNEIGARHVGSVYGAFGPDAGAPRILKYLRSFNFEKRVVPHSGHLKKIEVRQLNGVLNSSYGNKSRRV